MIRVDLRLQDLPHARHTWAAAHSVDQGRRKRPHTTVSERHGEQTSRGKGLAQRRIRDAIPDSE